jgi:single-strand DNA-binding protein
MKAMNNEVLVTVEGWVARPPQRLGREESTWVTFRMGSTCWWRNAQGEHKDGPTSWYDVKVSQGDMADNVLLSLQNGDPVLVYGRLTQKTWTDRDGKERASAQINAKSVGHSLRWGQAWFKRHSTAKSFKERAAVTDPDVVSDVAEDVAGRGAQTLGTVAPDAAGISEMAAAVGDSGGAGVAADDASMAQLSAGEEFLTPAAMFPDFEAELEGEPVAAA